MFSSALPELNPLYSEIKQISDLDNIEIDIDPDTQKYIDAEEASIDDEGKSITSGQRYAAAFFIKNNKVYFRARPSFNNVRKNPSALADKAEKARKHFGCKSLKDVIFPNDHKWTGVVHAQLIERISELEPEVAAGATILSFGFYKKDGKFIFANKAGSNINVCRPDPLATAYLMFYPVKQMKEYAVEFDLLYHIVRAMSEKITRKLMGKTTQKLTGDEANADFSQIENFVSEQLWERIRVKFRTQREEAIKDIHEMLMQNLYIYLSALSVKSERWRAEGFLQDGFIAARKHGIKINLNYLPHEFKDDKHVLKKAQESEFKSMYQFLLRYHEDNIIEELEKGNLDQAKALLIDTLNLELKEPVNETEFKKLLIKVISEIPPNFNKQNDKGETLLHLLAKTYSNESSFTQFLLKNKANPNILDKHGRVPLHYCVENRSNQMIDELLANGANLIINSKEGVKFFSCMLQRYRHDSNLGKSLITILKSGVIFPDLFASDSEIYQNLLIFFTLTSNDKYSCYDFITLIKNQNNPVIRAKLEKVLVLSLANFNANTFESRALPILQLTDLKIENLDNLSHDEISEIITTKIDDIRKSDPDAAMQIIDKINNCNTGICKQLFDHSKEFKEKLFKLKDQTMNTQRVKLFQKYAEEGDLISAKNSIQNLSISFITSQFELVLSPHLAHLASLLMEEKPDFNRLDKNGDTVLHLVASHGNTALLKSLLECNADPNILNSYNIGPLRIAIQNLKWDNVNLLLAKNANIETCDNFTNGIDISEDSLYIFNYFLAENHDVKIIKYFLKITGFVIEHPDYHGLSLDQVLGNFIKYVESLKNKDDQIDLLNLILDDTSSIGSWLLNLEHNLTTFQPKNYRVILVDMRTKLSAERDNSNNFIPPAH